ncbi:hypothetical protein BGZ47_002692 [Haplosporangium gracile]|nr:hypothetical protein BGZ47_002692 [Haplosporangium gracile]
MSDARKALRLIERANQMDLKAVMRILRLSHGLHGKERRILLQPFVDSTRARTLSTNKLSAAIIASGASTPAPTTTEPLISGTLRDSTAQHRLSEHLLASKEDPAPLFFRKQRTVPPILSPPLVSLIQDASRKSVQPVLPQPLFKPLHGKREANLRWRFLTKQISKVKPPLAGEIRQEIERKSRIGLPRNNSLYSTEDDIVVTLENAQDRIEWEQRIITTIKAWNKTGQESKRNRWVAGRFHPSIGGKPAKSNTLTLRLYRRIWQQLLNEIPILDVKLTAPGPSNHGSKGVQETLKDSRPERSSPQTPAAAATAYSVSKSAQSHQARSSAGLKLHALVNDFDQLGFAEQSQSFQAKLRKKAARA